MTARRLAPLAAAIALLLAACAPPPAPKGLAPPTASEAAPGGSRQGARIAAPPDARLVGLRVSVDNAPPDLLDDGGAGVLTFRRQGEREPIRLVFANGALGVYALPRGIYRIESVAGHRCGDVSFVLGPGSAPLSLGGIALDFRNGTAGTLSGRLPLPEDIERIAGLIGEDARTIAARPPLRGGGIPCARDSRAVSRPDIDPTIRRLTPAEIAGTVVLGGLLAAAGGAAIATGTFVFLSGSAGGLLFLGL